MIVAQPATPSAPTLLAADSNGSPGGETTYLTSPYLTGTTFAGATVQLLNAGGTVQNTTEANGAGSYQVQVPGPLGIGSYPYRVNVIDQYGDISSPSAAQTIIVVNSPTPTPPPSPTPTPTPTPIQTVVFGEQPSFQRRHNKRGKPVGKPVLSGFTLDFRGPLISASASSAANYQLDTITTKKVKKKKVTILHPITNFKISYSAASDEVEITLGSNVAFPTGGQLTVYPGVATDSGGTLSGTTVFIISKGGKSIGPS